MSEIRLWVLVFWGSAAALIMEETTSRPSQVLPAAHV